METPILAVVAVLCTGAALMWGRSARLRLRIADRVARDLSRIDAVELSRSTYQKDLLVFGIFSLGAVGATVGAVLASPGALLLGVLAIPAVVSLVQGRKYPRHARLSMIRWDLERRAEETLSQNELAPKQWADRLAPESFADIGGFDIGQVYQAGAGVMAGDFYDVFALGRNRVAAVIGDVTGHGIEASITAFQGKYLLRVFLQQFRDPAQALEHLNAQMSEIGHAEEFISLCVVVFDKEAGTLRYASAGHPAMWMWHQRDVQPLRATGPLVMLDPTADYISREVQLEVNDLVVMYTDGLAEARAGTELFGEERVAAAIRRNPGAAPSVICKELIEAARDFATTPISDDVAILAIRRV